MNKKLMVLVVEDSESDAALDIRALEQAGYRPSYERVEDAKQMEAALKKQAWDVIIVDHHLPEMNSFKALELLKESGQDIPVIVVSGAIGEETAVMIMKAGAKDYVMKDNLIRLAPAVERELQEFKMRCEQRKSAEALRRSEDRYRTILEEIEEGYYEVDLEGTFTFANDAACRQLGYPKEELIGMNYRSYVPKEDAKNVYRTWNKVFRTGEPVKCFPFNTIKKDGTHICLESSISPMRNKEGKIIGFRSISHDITERKQFERKLAQMATHDSLTGLPNRILLSDRLMVGTALARRNGHRLAVLMLDLDKFKDVNDAMGHGVGDELLKAVGQRLSSIMRKSDTISRIGGDEFVLVLPQISHIDDVTKFTQRILNAFEEPFVFGPHRIEITTSIGIALYPDDGIEIDHLLKHADSAMYWVKDNGRGTYKYYGLDDGIFNDIARRRAVITRSPKASEH
jgi:diguanylate cyclase (GGDEF)-like protein/PAS domain S-box-containing protein